MTPRSNQPGNVTKTSIDDLIAETDRGLATSDSEGVMQHLFQQIRKTDDPRMKAIADELDNRAKMSAYQGISNDDQTTTLLTAARTLLVSYNNEVKTSGGASGSGKY